MSAAISPSANGTSSTNQTTSSTNSHQPKGEMSDFYKGRIVGWHDEGISKREIGRRLRRNESTIRSFLKRYAENGQNPNNATPSGRPPNVTKELGDRNLEIIEGDRSIQNLSIKPAASSGRAGESPPPGVDC
ncbi:hypothetical protein BGX38DRAFT_1273814 [Terfezia claveryi]|nr:hypothetical protein BGX38DRAFT_1273814 [Terfezia claveryi]